MELANEHRTLREMLRHGLVDENDQYRQQTIKDNVSLLTREVLDEINQIVVSGGHALLGKADEPLAGRCDSAVVETDVHFPTDTCLLTDAMRKVLGLCGQAGEMLGVLGWRQFCSKEHERPPSERRVLKSERHNLEGKARRCSRGQLCLVDLQMRSFLIKALPTCII